MTLKKFSFSFDAKSPFDWLKVGGIVLVVGLIPYLLLIGAVGIAIYVAMKNKNEKAVHGQRKA